MTFATRGRRTTGTAGPRTAVNDTVAAATHITQRAACKSARLTGTDLLARAFSHVADEGLLELDVIAYQGRDEGAGVGEVDLPQRLVDLVGGATVVGAAKRAE
jgi:hypothetical protein